MFNMKLQSNCKNTFLEFFGELFAINFYSEISTLSNHVSMLFWSSMLQLAREKLLIIAIITFRVFFMLVQFSLSWAHMAWNWDEMKNSSSFGGWEAQPFRFAWQAFFSVNLRFHYAGNNLTCAITIIEQQIEKFAFVHHLAIWSAPYSQ